MRAIEEPALPISISRLKKEIQARGKELARAHAQSGETFTGAYENRQAIEALVEDLEEEIPRQEVEYLGETPIFHARDVFYNAYKAELFKLRNPRRLAYLCRTCRARLRPETRSDLRIKEYGHRNLFCSVSCGLVYAVHMIEEKEGKRG